MRFFVQFVGGAVLGMLLMQPAQSQAQSTAPSARVSHRGVVWTPPTAFPAAAQALRAMHARGMTAVRTTRPIVDERLLALADTLGFHLYQDLPITSLSAPALADTLAYARRQLAEVLYRAQSHPSARHFGLARLSDTSDPAACTFFRELAAQVQAANLPGSQVYYTTPFVDADRCASAVDRVLLDARNVNAPRRMMRWQAAHPATPAGIGAMGTWVRPEAPPGLRVPHSPQAQARFLEHQLATFWADTLSAVPEALFVYQWQDVDSLPGDPYGRAYGLWQPNGMPRPALRVVTGFLTSRQHVFAFSAGTAPERPVPWLLFIGWGLVGGLAVAYFREPLLRNMAARYFGSHRFYQEAVGEGRDVLIGTSLLLLGGAALTAGVLGVIAARCYNQLQAVTWALAGLPDPLRTDLAQLLEAPWAFGAVVAGGYVLSLAVWGGVLVAVARVHGRFSARQATMLIGWSHWPMLGVLVATMVVASVDVTTARLVLPTLLWIAGGVSLWMAGRAVADFAAVAWPPLPLAALTLLVSPLFVLGEIVLVLMLRHGVSVAFISHLLTRT